MSKKASGDWYGWKAYCENTRVGYFTATNIAMLYIYICVCVCVCMYMVFPLVMYGHESWTLKKAKC